jgi:hypothetical protein
VACGLAAVSTFMNVITYRIKNVVSKYLLLTSQIGI